MYPLRTVGLFFLVTNLFHFTEADQPSEKLLEAGLISGKRFDT